MIIDGIRTINENVKVKVNDLSALEGLFFILLDKMNITKGKIALDSIFIKDSNNIITIDSIGNRDEEKTVILENASEEQINLIKNFKFYYKLLRGF